ncbi:MAG: hypothetical protein HRT58_11845 [Crocinitomicaceae bacterium]|nr:hypothetical protein [Flavobacteriales bacterium]NQZ36352.1 hypothetical protein [Crocinitomicaceae bacterium]
MIRKAVFTLILLALLFSCKKDKLTGDRAILIGQWEWIYSIKKYNYYSPPFGSFEETILPSSVSNSYSLEFFEKGKVKYLENNNAVDGYRIAFSTFSGTGSCPVFMSGGHEFSIDLDNDQDNFINGCVNSDTLLFYGGSFPIENLSVYPGYSVSTRHFFKKVN